MTASKLSSSISLKRSAIKRSRELVLRYKARLEAADATIPVVTCKPSSSSSSSISSMKRSVSFGENIQVIKVQPVDESMKNELFYCRSDYRRFRKESKRISNMLDQRLTLGSSMTLTCSPNMISNRHHSLSLKNFCLR